MARILIALGAFSLALMGAALVLGLMVGDLYDRPGETTLRWATVHRLTGTFAALAVVFVQSVVVTYFIGTSRWCKEVVETYRLDPALAAESQQLKRRTFPWVVSGMLVVVGVGALGAAADPATGRVGTEAWTKVHLAAAMAGVAYIAWTYFVAWNHVIANHAVIERIVERVAEVRDQRGLDTDNLDTKGDVPAKSSATAASGFQGQGDPQHEDRC